MNKRIACIVFMMYLQGYVFCNSKIATDNTDTTQTIELPADFSMNTLLASKRSSSKAHSLHYLEAYLQGSIDTHFPHTETVVTIKKDRMILSNLPKDKETREKIIAYVEKLSCNTRSNGHDKIIADASDTIPKITTPLQLNNPLSQPEQPVTEMWLPQSTVVFPTLVADPRQISFSVGQRFRDTLGGQRCSAVSFGDQLPLYRWCNIWKWSGDLQLELEGGVFAVFNHTRPSAPLCNADYYVGVPITYATGPWAYRFRVYHISSHLGDELHKVHKHVSRKNKSFEAVDFFTSYYITDEIRVYGGLGVIGHSDSEMHIRPFYIQYGTEVRVGKHNFSQLYGVPFLAINIQNSQTHRWKFDSTFALGYEWGKIQGFGRKLRAFVEYHQGFSPDGQFYRKRSDYIAFRIAYGF